MPKMVCVECQTQLDIKKNGVYVVEMFNKPQTPYKIWSADLWYCKQCQTEIVAAFGEKCLSEHYESDFQEFLERIKNQTNNPVIYSYEWFHFKEE